MSQSGFVKEISDYAEIVEILKNESYMIEGSTEESFDVSEHKKYRNNFKDFLQSNMAWIKSLFHNIWIQNITHLDKSAEFELTELLINPFLNDLIFVILGIEDKKIRSLLAEQSKTVFNMKNSIEANEAASIAATEIAEFFRNHLEQQTSQSNNNICAKFIADKSEKSIAHLIQFLIAGITSMPLLLANQLYLILKDEKIKKAYLSDPKGFSNRLIGMAGPSKYLYRIAAVDCPYKKGTLLKMNIKDGFEVNLKKRSRKETLSLGVGMFSCLGSPFIKAITDFFPKAFFEHFPNAEVLDKSLETGGSIDVEGVIKLVIRLNQ